MLTRKQFTLMLLTAVTTGGLVALAQTVKKPDMTSTAMEWNSIEAKANANGTGKSFLNGPCATLDLLDCHATMLRPGASNHEILKRPDDEVIIVKEGTIEAYVGDKWVRLTQGGVIFNAKDADQAIRNVGDGPATYYVVMFRPGTRAAGPTTKAGV